MRRMSSARAAGLAGIFAWACSASAAVGCGDDAPAGTDTAAPSDTGGETTGDSAAPGETVAETTVETAIETIGDETVATDTGETAETTDATETTETTDSAETTELPDYEHDPAKIVLHDPCALDKRVGGFEVVMNEDVGYTAVAGSVKNGLVPGQVPTVALAEGGCKVLHRPRLFCDPPCDSASTCGTGGACVAAPVGQDVGTVTIRGLNKLVEIVATQPGNTYFYTRLTHPGFAPGDVIQLLSTAGYLGKLELYGIGVAEITPQKIVLTQGQSATVTWDVPPAGARSQVHVDLNIDQHGLSPANVVCDFPDTGSGTIPAAVVDGLIAAGVTGFPSGNVTRRTLDSVVVGDQCADFAVAALHTATIEVTNFIPCTSQANCPEGTTCNLTVQQCQ